MLHPHDGNTSHDKDTWKSSSWNLNDEQYETTSLSSVDSKNIWTKRNAYTERGYKESYDSSDLNKHLLSGEHGFCPFPLQELGRNKASVKIFPCFGMFRPEESYNKTPFEEHSSPSWVSGSTEGMLAEPPSGDVAQRQKTAAADPGPCNGRVVSSTFITSTAVPVGRFCYDT